MQVSTFFLSMTVLMLLFLKGEVESSHEDFELLGELELDHGSNWFPWTIESTRDLISQKLAKFTIQ